MKDQDKLEKLAWERFLEIIGSNEVPLGDADNLVVGTIKKDDLLILKVSLTSGKIEISENGFPVDNHWDTKNLCEIAIHSETEEISVTIVNEMPWLQRSNSIN
jgi:hypothetical protein